MNPISGYTMSWKPWPEVTAAHLEATLSGWVQRRDVDVLLTRGDWPGEGWNYLGWNPTSEYVEFVGIHKEPLKEFAFSNGAPVMGFLGYSAGYQGTGRHAIRTNRRFPTVSLRRFSVLVRWSSKNDAVDVIAGTKQAMEHFLVLLASVAEEVDAAPVPPDPRTLTASMSPQGYRDAVETALAGIRRGDYYQINLAMEFTLEADPKGFASWFMQLAQSHPAPFYGLLKRPGFQVLSTSPELFLRVRDGHVLSKPIKGTAKVDPDVDVARKTLLDSPKEAAELSMIVDLVRNDISFDCKPGSVAVERHREVFQVDRLLQVCSEVHGDLNEDRDVVDLLLDAFPGGSVTGCPKQSAMKEIARLEGFDRTVYCGCLVVIHDRKNLDSSIAIRTGILDEKARLFRFYAGSGIVVDSLPDAEYRETLAKGEKFVERFL